MELKQINISGLERYQITPDGQVYNTRTKRWIKPFVTRLGYYSYGLSNGSKRLNYCTHRLVAFTYIGLPLNKKHEIDHIDENKGNNHYSNLQWISHSDNVRKSFKLGTRGCWWLGKSRPQFTLEHRKKMADAKFKAINMYLNGVKINVFKSVNDAAKFFNVNRVTIFLIMKNRQGIYKNYVLKFAKQRR